MPKHLYVFLILTFFMGMLAGMYIYFLTRSPEAGYLHSSVSTHGYEIIGTTYGGCEHLGCRSLLLRSDGSYAYLVNDADGTFARYEDFLSKDQQEDLKRLVKETDLGAVQASRFTGECPVNVDGIAYRYKITIEGEIYNLDSCRMSLDEIPLFEELEQYFDTMMRTYDSHDLF